MSKILYKNGFCIDLSQIEAVSMKSRYSRHSYYIYMKSGRSIRAHGELGFTGDGVEEILVLPHDELVSLWKEYLLL